MPVVKITKKMELPTEVLAKMLKVKGTLSALEVKAAHTDMRGEAYGPPRTLVITWTEEEEVE